MKIDIKKWIADFYARVLATFKERLIFLGLQGSYGRGEQTSTSDIDVVVILDKVEFADLQSYCSIINQMKCRDLVCGFVAGMPELLAWEKYDLLQLYLDTVPYFGSLDFLKEHFNKEDIKRAVRVGACNVYHAASHNFLHARDMVALKDIYKAARFVARMKHYLYTGIYVSEMNELIKVVSSEDSHILAVCMQSFTDNNESEFTEESEILIEWASNLIRECSY